MPLLTQADLERTMRAWFYRLVLTGQSSEPTNRAILSLFVSTVDRVIQLDPDAMQTAVQLAAKYDGCPQEEVVAAIEQAALHGIARGHRATKGTHVLQAVVARMAHQSKAEDRVRIDPEASDVFDFLDAWFTSQPSDRRQEQPGGAPAVIAHVLAQLGELNVALWTAFLSQGQANMFDERVKFLAIDDQHQYSIKDIHEAGRSGDPEIRNYSLEFAKGAQFVFERPGVSTTRVISTAASDRVIAISPGYRFFDQTGRVDIDRSRAIPAGISHILAADPQRGPSCAAQVAQDRSSWVIGGLHHVSNPAEQLALESDLRQVPPNVTIHVEIPGSDISPWFHQVLQRYVDSIGVNVDDIERLAQAMVNNELTHINPPEPIPEFQHEYFLRLAFWLACELDIERVYVHGLQLDYIVRRHASGDKMDQEVRADLLAKTVVANRARAARVVDRPSRLFGLSASNLESFIEVCSLRAFPIESKWAALENLPAFERILRQGWFKDTFDYQDQEIAFLVGVIPVALFRLDPGGLKFVGAGDTTSAVSFVFGQFTSQGLKRRW